MGWYLLWLLLHLWKWTGMSYGLTCWGPTPTWWSKAQSCQLASSAKKKRTMTFCYSKFHSIFLCMFIPSNKTKACLRIEWFSNLFVHTFLFTMLIWFFCSHENGDIYLGEKLVFSYLLEPPSSILFSVMDWLRPYGQKRPFPNTRFCSHSILNN